MFDSLAFKKINHFLFALENTTSSLFNNELQTKILGNCFRLIKFETVPRIKYSSNFKTEMNLSILEYNILYIVIFVQSVRPMKHLFGAKAAQIDPVIYTYSKE